MRQLMSVNDQMKTDVSVDWYWPITDISLLLFNMQNDFSFYRAVKILVLMYNCDTQAAQSKREDTALSNVNKNCLTVLNDLTC